MKEKSITINGIGEELIRKIQEKSRQYKLNQNETIKKILENSLLKKTKSERENDFADLFGVWSKEEKKEFDKNVKDFEVINPKDWK